MQQQHRFSWQPTPVILCLAVALAVSPAQAEEASLAPVVVKDTVDQEITTVITKEALENRTARNLRDVLQQALGVTVAGGPAIAQKIYVNGIVDTMLTTTLDGAPQNGQTFHHQSRLLIDPELLKQLELTPGGSAASAGPGALAGSLQMTTKDGRDLLRAGQTLGGSVRGGTSSNDGNRLGVSLYGLIDDKVDFLLSGNQTKTGDYKDGNSTVQANSGATQDSGLAKLNWHIAPGQRLTVGYQTVEDEGVRYLRPNMWGLGSARNGPPMPQKTRRETLNTTYRFDGDTHLPGLEVHAFSDRLTVERTTPVAQTRFNKPANYRFGEQVNADGVNILTTSRLGGIALRYGLNHHRFQSSAINPNPLDASSNGHEHSQVSGIFAESSVPLDARWLLGAGARYDWYDYTDNHQQTFTSHGMSPNVSLTWLATDVLNVYARLSHTLRGAGMKEVFYIDNTTWRNDAKLKEEQADNAEIGFAYDAGAWHYKGSVFRLNIADYITTGSDYITNVGDMHSSGYKLGGGWRSGPFHADVNVTHARPKLNGHDLGEMDDSLGVSTGRTWGLDLGYSIPAWNLDLGWTSLWVAKHAYIDRTTTAKVKNGYAVHDLSANWQPLGKDHVRVTFSVHNLLNTFYYDQGTYAYVNSAGSAVYYGYAEPGRDVRLDLSWKF